MKETTVAPNTPVWVFHPSKGVPLNDLKAGDRTWLPTWTDLTGDLHQFTSKADLGRRSAGMPNDTGLPTRLWSLAREMQPGHVVIVPEMGERSLHLFGKVHEGYRFRDDASPHRRHGITLEWLRTDLDASAFDADLRRILKPGKKFLFKPKAVHAARILRTLEHGFDPGAGGSSRQSLSRFLIRAADQAHADPRTTSIRELLTHWGHQRRTTETISQVRFDLSRSGLATDPDFAEGDFDDPIRLIPIEAASSGAGFPGAMIEAATLSLLVSTFTVRRDPISIDTPVEEVRALMVKKDLSQLAVVDAEGTYLGAVTSDKLMAAPMVKAPLTLEQALDGRVHCVYRQDLLLDKIDLIHRHGFVFVHSADRRTIDGVITATDLTRSFEFLLTPIVLLEEIERRLRRAIDDRLTPAEIRKYAKFDTGPGPAAADLTLGAYADILAVDRYWGRLGWSSRTTLIDSLKEVVPIRNAVMHFSKDPVSPTQIKALEGLLNLLRTVQRHL